MVKQLSPFLFMFIRRLPGQYSPLGRNSFLYIDPFLKEGKVGDDRTDRRYTLDKQKGPRRVPQPLNSLVGHEGFESSTS
jgi:hypothetical protein